MGGIDIDLTVKSNYSGPLKTIVIASVAWQPRRMLSCNTSSTPFYSPCKATRLPRYARNDKVEKFHKKIPAI